MGVPFADIKSMIVAGFKSSFQPFHEKQAALRRVGVELDKYDDNGNLRAVSAPGASDRPSRRPRGSAELVADAE
jgi:adenosine deaminase